MTVPVEKFEALEGIPGIRHGFLCRVPGLDVRADREEALGRLAQYHREARASLGLPVDEFGIAEQVHGNRVAVLTSAIAQEAPQTDGLVTNVPGLCLGIYVADCCAVYLVDPVRRAIGLLHSGKKGTEQEISVRAIETMEREYGSNPADIVAQLSPCIRPPLYEVDIASEIAAQLQRAGVGSVNDCGLNTGADLERFYSYRVEQGRTGRLLALLSIIP
jgi:hypothetical protein